MAQRTARKPSRVKPTKKSSFLSTLKPFFSVLLVLGLLTGTVYHYRNGLAYYLGFRSDKTSKTALEKQRISDVRNYTLLSKYEFNPVGIDISEYQGTIRWDSVGVVENDFPIRFIFVRATVGTDRPDLKFADNWNAIPKRGFLRGAYHYYRPNENSAQQAQLFIKTVVLQKGDFPPILDIEQMPRKQSMAQLKVGIQNWLNIVENHYGVRPILYSSERFYTDFLKDDFPEYTFWIANYNFFVENLKPDWKFWQFTEKGTGSGISGFVDINFFNGNEADLNAMTLGNGAFEE